MKPATTQKLPALDKVSKDLRSAVIAGDHRRAAGLAVEYTSVVKQVWESFSDAERTASTLPVTSRELFSWVREMTMVQRALAADHLVFLQKIKRYRQANQGHAR